MHRRPTVSSVRQGGSARGEFRNGSSAGPGACGDPQQAFDFRNQPFSLQRRESVPSVPNVSDRNLLGGYGNGWTAPSIRGSRLR